MTKSGLRWTLPWLWACASIGLALGLTPQTVRSAEPPAVPSARVRAWQTGLLRPDRLQHASFSLASGLAVGVLARRPSDALYGALALGLVKELWDWRRGHFDPIDLAADGVGAGLAALATRGLKP